MVSKIIKYHNDLNLASKLLLVETPTIKGSSDSVSIPRKVGTGTAKGTILNFENNELLTQNVFPILLQIESKILIWDSTGRIAVRTRRIAQHNKSITLHQKLLRRYFRSIENQ